MKKHLPSEKASKVPSVSFWVKKTLQQQVLPNNAFHGVDISLQLISSLAAVKSEPTERLGESVTSKKKKGLTQKLFNLSSKVLRNFKSRSVTFLWEMDQCRSSRYLDQILKCWASTFFRRRSSSCRNCSASFPNRRNFMRKRGSLVKCASSGEWLSWIN